MNFIALRMLTGDRSKYLAIVFGVAFASLLMSQQCAIFCGLMRNTGSQIRDASGADIWVMAPGSRHVDAIRNLPEIDLQRVRSVPGVAWAAKVHKSQTQLLMDDGRFESVFLIGVDDDAQMGVPRRFVVGDSEDLRRPDAVFLDTFGYRYLFGDDAPFETGRTFEINDRRGVVVGIVEASPPFITLPVVYCRYQTALGFIPPQRRLMSYVLVGAGEGIDHGELCRSIEQRTGLMAMTDDEFVWSTVGYYMERTGIPVNFGITILLGFIVGCAIAGQTFYLFVVENIRQLGMLKAMGVANWTLTRMVLLQALVVGLLGYGIGVGLAVVAGLAMKTFITKVPPVFFMPWQILVGTGVAVLVMVFAAGVFSLKRVLTLEPAIVFR